MQGSQGVAMYLSPFNCFHLFHCIVMQSFSVHFYYYLHMAFSSFPHLVYPFWCVSLLNVLFNIKQLISIVL